jgi:hypothetical protein
MAVMNKKLLIISSNKTDLSTFLKDNKKAPGKIPGALNKLN